MSNTQLHEVLVKLWRRGFRQSECLKKINGSQIRQAVADVIGSAFADHNHYAKELKTYCEINWRASEEKYSFTFEEIGQGNFVYTILDRTK